MSLFSCLKELRERQSFVYDYLYDLKEEYCDEALVDTCKKYEMEITALDQLIRRMQLRIRSNDYEDLIQELDLLVELSLNTVQRGYQWIVASDLRKMISDYDSSKLHHAMLYEGRQLLHLVGEISLLKSERLCSSRVDVYLNAADRHLNRIEACLSSISVGAEFQIWKISHCVQSSRLISHQLGAKGGVCFGLVNLMTQPKYSLFKGLKGDLSQLLERDAILAINEKIVNYQEAQGMPLWDVRSQRLTRVMFSSDAREQAKMIYRWAKLSAGKHIRIDLGGSSVGHCFYLRLTQKTVEFLDPNAGAFAFPDKRTFERFYSRLMFCYSDSPFYQLFTMHFDPFHLQPETHTWEGVWRSVLTGPKYESQYWLAPHNIGLVLGLMMVFFCPHIELLLGLSKNEILALDIGLLLTVVIQLVAEIYTGIPGLLAVPFALRLLCFSKLTGTDQEIECETMDLEEIRDQTLRLIKEGETLFQAAQPHKKLCFNQASNHRGEEPVAEQKIYHPQ